MPYRQTLPYRRVPWSGVPLYLPICIGKISPKFFSKFFTIFFSKFLSSIDSYLRVTLCFLSAFYLLQMIFSRFISSYLGFFRFPIFPLLLVTHALEREKYPIPVTSAGFSALSREFPYGFRSNSGFQLLRVIALSISSLFPLSSLFA